MNTIPLDAVLDHAAAFGARVTWRHPAPGVWVILWAHEMERREATGPTLEDTARGLCDDLGIKLDELRIIAA